MDFPGYLVIEPESPTLREYFSYAGISGSTFTGLVRGITGSVAAGQIHASGVKVRAVPMQQFYEDIWADILGIETSYLALDGSLAI